MGEAATALEPQQARLPETIEARVEQAVHRAQMLEQMVGSVLKEGIDYGTIPGTPKPTLYQPGAQQLAFVFGLTPEFTVEHETFDHKAEPPFISYTVRCRVVSRESSEVVAEGVGSCNSMEVRYRYRKQGSQRVLNTEVADLANTILKMASKRALVAGVLNATAASRVFTQDVEDMAPEHRPQQDEQRGRSTGNGRASTQSTNPCSEAQRKACYALARKAEADKDTISAAIKSLYGADKLDQLTKAQASDLIDRLQRAADGKEGLDTALGFQNPDSEPEESAKSPEGVPLDEGDVPF